MPYPYSSIYPLSFHHLLFRFLFGSFIESFIIIFLLSPLHRAIKPHPQLAQGTLWRHKEGMYCRRPEFPSHLTPNATVLFPNLTIIFVPKLNQCTVDLVRQDKTHGPHRPETLKGRLSTSAADTKGQNISMLPPGMRTCPPFQFWLFFGVS